MNQLVSTILNDVVLKSKKDINPKIVINAIHFCMAMNATLKRAKVQLHDGKRFDLNYFAITFSNSGSGKDLALSIVQSIFKEHTDGYHSAMMNKLSEAIDEDDFSIPNIITKEGTQAGILNERYSLDVIGIGSTNIKVEELVAVMKNPNFHDVMNILTESWSDGHNEAVSRLSKVYPEIHNVPINCIMYSSPSGFRNNQSKAFTEFSDTLANGFSRRSHMVFIDDEINQEEEPEPTIESMKLEIENSKQASINKKDITDYVNQVLLVHGLNKTIGMTDESTLRLKQYEIQLKNRVKRTPLIKDAVRAELLSRWFKIVRLAALYAFYDGSDEVSVENVEDAIEWADSLNKDLSIILNAETAQEKIYDYLVKAGKYSSQTDIIKYLGIKPNEFKESISELFTVAYDTGSIVQKKVFDEEGNVIKYNLIHGKPTDKGRMICSASNHPSTGFEPMYIDYDNIPNLVNGEYGRNYSAGHFIDNHRKKDNFIKKSNLIMFDIDDGTTIEEALVYLSSYRGYISTTKSHQIVKHPGEKSEQPACDRFRVILVSKFEFNLEIEEHKHTMKNMADFIGLKIDTAAVDVARFYYSHEGEIFNLKGTELVDLRDYIVDTKQNEQLNKVVNDIDSRLYSQSDYDPRANVNRFDKWCLRNAIVGSRNNILYYTFGALLEHTDLSEGEAVSKIYSLNSMLPAPLPENELDLLLRPDSSLKR